MPESIAKAYVQILPTTQGITNNLEQELGGEVGKAGTSAGKSFGSNLLSTLAKIGIAKKIGDTFSDAILQGSSLQQSLGGIETLFKDNADTVKEYAAEAYKTTGLSANAYMESVTGFSASLLQSLGGDTQKAADIANMAMVDMSDNANKMGTSMESIQNAYQGFAKQNYTMLDNLKLGYGGNEDEMARLLADAEKLTGQKYDINNLSDVYEAIHAIQGEIGITGTTAKEAASTVSGSVASMKASWQNILGNLALGEDITAPLQQMIDTASTFIADNLAPMMGNIVASAPEAINTLLNGILPNIVPMAFDLLNSITNALIDGLPELLQTIVDNLPTIINQVIDGTVNFLLNGLPRLGKALGDSMPIILQGALEMLGGLLKAIPQVLIAAVGSIGEVGAQLIDGLWNGILGKLDWLLEKIKGFGQSVLGGIKSVFGIASPSKEMAWVGEMIDKGLANGIAGNAGYVEDAMMDVAGVTMDTAMPDMRRFSNPSFSGFSSAFGFSQQRAETATAYDGRPIILQVVLDKRVIGEAAWDYREQRARSMA